MAPDATLLPSQPRRAQEPAPNTTSDSLTDRCRHAAAGAVTHLQANKAATERDDGAR